jgi:hypothetical protein
MPVPKNTRRNWHSYRNAIPITPTLFNSGVDVEYAEMGIGHTVDESGREISFPFGNTCLSFF